MTRVYKLDVYVASNFDVIERIDDAYWELVETIEGTSEKACLDKAEAKYDMERHHWANPYQAKEESIVTYARKHGPRRVK